MPRICCVTFVSAESCGTVGGIHFSGLLHISEVQMLVLSSDLKGFKVRVGGGAKWWSLWYELVQSGVLSLCHK